LIQTREFAVRNLDEVLRDSDVLDILLQLVQSLKYEPYIQSPLVKFLLERALGSRLIGHYFFWHLRSEISGKSWLDVRFGLFLEAYCRGLSGHMRFLYKQVEALDKLTVLTDSLREKKDEAPKDRLRYVFILMHSCSD
jgi:phosphatidylinositol-4,5-bisphosphate 3-kinase